MDMQGNNSKNIIIGVVITILVITVIVLTVLLFNMKDNNVKLNNAKEEVVQREKEEVQEKEIKTEEELIENSMIAVRNFLSDTALFEIEEYKEPQDILGPAYYEFNVSQPVLNVFAGLGLKTMAGRAPKEGFKVVNEDYIIDRCKKFEKDLGLDNIVEIEFHFGRDEYHHVYFHLKGEKMVGGTRYLFSIMTKFAKTEDGKKTDTISEFEFDVFK